MGETPTWTWPNPQNGKQPHLKFRLGTYVSPTPKRPSQLDKSCQSVLFLGASLAHFSIQFELTWKETVNKRERQKIYESFADNKNKKEKISVDNFKKTKNRGKKLVNGTENESPGIKSREDLRGNEIG